MSEKLLRQMFLIALQSTQDGEALAAMRKAAQVAKAQGLDPHALADRLVKAAPAASSDDARTAIVHLTSRVNQLTGELIVTQGQLRKVMSLAAQLKEENTRLKNDTAQKKAPPPAARREEVEWRRRAQQLLGNAADLNNREEEFLTSILERGWSLSDRQAKWLDNIWEKHF